MSDNWNLRGTYFEACSCDIACPCTFLSAPTTGECSVLIGWHIDEGNFEKVNLGDLNVALAAYAPGHMLEVKWRVALYLDERATEAQKNALTQIYTGQVGGLFGDLVSLIGEVMGISSVPIEYESNGKRRRLKIGDVGETDIEAIKDQGGADVLITNPPMSVAPGGVLVVAKSGKLSYKDHGLQWEISGKNGFYAPFNYQGS